MLLNCGVGEDSWESLELQGDPASPFWRRSVLGVHWWDWFWSWNSNTLATWCEELTHLKRPWCWEKLKTGGEGDDRGWDGWMASPTQWKWVWVDSGSWWWTGRPSVLRFMRSQRVRHEWVTELNWRAPTTSTGSINKSSNSSPLSWWCHPTISSSVIPFSSCLQSFKALWVSSSQQVAVILELQLQHQSFQCIFRIDFLYD